MTRRSRAAARVSTGSSILAGRIARWPGAGETWQARLARVLWAAFVVWAGWRMVQHSRPVMAPLALWWTIAAYRAAADTVPEEEPEEEPAPRPKASPEEARAYLLPLIRARIADGRGVHLDTLLADLIDRQVLPAGYRVTALRRDLEDVGIPIREQLKVGRSNRMGVHRDDLGGVDATTPPAPAPAVHTGRTAA